MFENPTISFFSILILTSFVGFGTSMFFYKTSLLKRALISPIIGYAIISLATAYLSYAGFGTEQIALPLLIVLTLLSAIALFFRRQKIINPERLSLKLLIPITLFGLANATILLAPTVLEQAPYLFNDHATYISISEYLRNFGYFTPADPITPFWENNTWQYQAMHLRMGAQFFVSFFASLLQVAHTITTYPSILGFVAFALICSIAFLYTNFREKESSILEITFVLFFFLIAINLNSQNLAIGFLPQTLGIVIFIVLTALVYKTFYTNKKSHILIGLLFASLTLTYHEITLFYGAGIFTLIVFEFFFKRNRDKQFFGSIILIHLLALALSPIATREFVLGIYTSSQTNGVGWNVPYSLTRYFQDIFGQDIHYVLQNNFQRYITIPGLFGSFIFIYLLLRKKIWTAQKSLSQFLFCIFLPFVLAIGLYRYLKFDPFTSQLGHSWNIFKLVSWSYWIIPVITGIATFSYFKESFSKKVLISLLCLSLLPSVGGNIYANYLSHKYEIELYTNNYNDPLNDFEYLAKNREHYSPANIIDYPHHPNYPYLILSILKDNSVGDLNIFGSMLTPSTSPDFYQWINYLREHNGTEEPIKKLAGFFIYPPQSSIVYLFDGFSQRENYGDEHLAWLTTHTGTLKVVVPKNEKAKFMTTISNWQEKTEEVEIIFNDETIFSSSIGINPLQFTSPILEEGNHVFTINYYGQQHTPDTSDGRTLSLMLKNTDIISIK